LVEEDPRCSPENPMFETVDQPGIGSYLMPGSPVRFGGLERLPVKRAPLLGEHTDDILGGVLGRSAEEIARLHEEGVVAVAPPAD
ncbi:MAG TPA: 2-methylfumaryl-CoA isomerase, partial [Solirubrobacteraceae bacterium]|nr:2-methylfumaryl-CoA isomerase [Solirubrobacteraceae bacterium]